MKDIKINNKRCDKGKTVISEPLLEDKNRKPIKDSDYKDDGFSRM